MQLGRVIGNATATVKHASMVGARLLVVQPVADGGREDGEPLLVVDTLGAHRGAEVLMSNDGGGARELLGAANSPVRWTVVGIPDERS